MKTTLTTLCCTLAGALMLQAIEVGKPAPDFTATDIEGNTHRLADFKGKIVVIEAYNLDCPYVANHYKTGAMQDLQAYVVSKGGVWLVVNSVNPKHPNYRTREAAKKEFAAQKIKATAWIDDSSGTLGKAYGLKTTPHMVIIDKEGRVVYDGAIDDKASTDHDPRKARNYVREALDQLLAGQPVTVSKTKPYGCSVKYAE